ncbi:MAG TPA: hypothetical protein VM260_26395 [Pirellula sp.]|nr:hypothetical protein [Pirellula sp.]
MDAVNAPLRKETVALNATVSEAHDLFAKKDQTDHRAPVLLIDKIEVLVRTVNVLKELLARIALNNQIDNRARKVRRVPFARKVQIVQSNQIERKDHIERTEPKGHPVPKVLNEAKDRSARIDLNETNDQLDQIDLLVRKILTVQLLAIVLLGQKGLVPFVEIAKSGTGMQTDDLVHLLLQSQKSRQPLDLEYMRMTASSLLTILQRFSMTLSWQMIALKTILTTLDRGKQSNGNRVQDDAEVAGSAPKFEMMMLTLWQAP